MTIGNIAILFFSIAIIFFLRWLLLQPKKYKNMDQEKINKFLNILLKRGLHGGVLVIKIPNTKMFIQFKKYVEDEKIGLSLDFPKAPWSNNYYDMVKKLIIDNQISTEIINQLDVNIKGKVTEFLIADFERNIFAAFDIAKKIINHIYAYDSSKPVTMYFIRINPLDEWTK